MWAWGLTALRTRWLPRASAGLGPRGPQGAWPPPLRGPAFGICPAPCHPQVPWAGDSPGHPRRCWALGVGMSSPAGALAATPTPTPTPCCCVRPQRWGLSQPPSPLQGSHHEQAPFLGGQRVSSAAWCADSGSSGVVGCLLFSLCPRWEGLPLQRPLCVGDRPRDCFPSPGAVPVARRDPDPSSC